MELIISAALTDVNSARPIATFSGVLNHQPMQTIEQIYRERLKMLIAEFGSQAKLSSTIETSPAQISQWLNASVDPKSGKPRTISRASARKIERLTGKAAGWMDQPTETSNVFPAVFGTRRIPVISHIQAGVWKEIVDNFQPGDADGWLTTDLDLSRSAFALEIQGDSMLPEFKPGDRVIIDPDVVPHPGDFVAAKNGGDDATFKKYRPRGQDAQGNQVFELVPLNEDFETLRSDQQTIHIVGTMVEHRKYRKQR